jgi:hypothetical protein
MNMMIIGCYDACAYGMSDMRLKETKVGQNCKEIEANVGRKAKHGAGEACPSGKLVAFGLIDRQLVGCKFVTFEVRCNVITALQCTDTCGKAQYFSVFALSTAITTCCISKKVTL